MILVQNEHKIENEINAKEFNEIFIGSNLSLREELLKCLASVLYHPEHHDSLFRIFRKLQINLKDIVQSYLDYNSDIKAFGNEIYESLSVRAVLHILNLLEGSWHQERQKTVLEYIELANSCTLVDIGFGIPSSYVKTTLFNCNRKITLCDFSESAFIFSKVLLNEWNPKWQEIIFLKNENMEENGFVGAFDLYIFQDSIEHVSHPTEYLSKCVQLSPPSSKFLIGLPIGPIIPSHFMAWQSTTEAEQWLKKCGLRIKMNKIIQVNPKVDLFAKPFNFSFKNFFVLCDKIQP